MSSTQERAAFVEQLRQLAEGAAKSSRGGRNVWWIMGLIASLCIGGISGLGSRAFDRIFPPSDSSAGYFSTAWKEKVDAHIVVSEFVIAEIRRNQEDTSHALASIQITLGDIRREQNRAQH